MSPSAQEDNDLFAGDSDIASAPNALQKLAMIADTYVKVAPMLTTRPRSDTTMITVQSRSASFAVTTRTFGISGSAGAISSGITSSAGTAVRDFAAKAASLGMWKLQRTCRIPTVMGSTDAVSATPTTMLGS
jgi:hypothetical protein